MVEKSFSEEVLMRYISGRSSLEEMAEISLAIKENPELKELVSILENLSDNGMLSESGNELPATDCAGASQDNLCDVICERYILRDYFGDSMPMGEEYLPQDNVWMKESGMPLHSIGRLLEAEGMSVIRRYECSIEDIRDALESHLKVIAVVDSGLLWHSNENAVFHAVVCLEMMDSLVKIYDPATDSKHVYATDEFLEAWRPSKNYMVCASADTLEYQPHPIDVSDISLDDDLVELTESLAENAHEVWASGRKEEGWTYGAERDDRLMTHPDIAPYIELPESEKQYDRDWAMHTIRLVKKLGFNITRKYTAYCQKCGEFVGDEMNFCPNCGARLPRE